MHSRNTRNDQNKTFVKSLNIDMMANKIKKKRKGMSQAKKYKIEQNLSYENGNNL